MESALEELRRRCTILVKKDGRFLAQTLTSPEPPYTLTTRTLRRYNIDRLTIDATPEGRVIVVMNGTHGGCLFNE